MRRLLRREEDAGRAGGQASRANAMVTSVITRNAACTASGWQRRSAYSPSVAILRAVVSGLNTVCRIGTVPSSSRAAVRSASFCRPQDPARGSRRARRAQSPVLRTAGTTTSRVPIALPRYSATAPQSTTL